jgi:hypothetical protein
MSPQARAAWVAALDDLEVDVAAAERLVAEVRTGHELPVIEPWTAPAGLGPIPDDLRRRADDILARQLRVATDIAAGIGATRRHAAVAARLDNRDATRPAYLDCAM